MRSFTTCLTLITFVTVMSCQQKIPDDHSLTDIETAFKNGKLTFVSQWANSLLNSGKTDSTIQVKLKSLMDMAARIKSDFTLSESETDARLNKAFGVFSHEEKAKWEKNNWLEYRVIDGQKYYFKRAVPNLKLILASKEPGQQGSLGLISDKLALFRLEHSKKVIMSEDLIGKPVEPVKMKISYQLTVNADVVPDGEMVKCWLPWPHEIHNRQRNVNLLKTIPDTHYIASDTVEQRSIYLEQPATKGKPVVFEIQYTYQSMAQYFDLNKVKIIPYNSTSKIYKKYTAEQYPQIVFSKKIKQLSDSIVKGTSDPAKIVKKLYYWINDHIIWTGALEYSIMPDIPGYVLSNRRGDCGMQTLLFMTMARYEGIPVKWQSGWMMHPNEVNLHDWCEVYYEGVGWVPLDMSFNLQKSDNIPEKEFYINGIDAYRLIVNDAIGTPLVPKKEFPRSEPYDFQRGEVEWRGGNLYFNKWNYKMNVEY